MYDGGFHHDGEALDNNFETSFIIGFLTLLYGRPEYIF
jgi:hypothetical protein